MGDKDVKSFMKMIRKGKWDKEEQDEELIIDYNTTSENKKFQTRLANFLRQSKIITAARIFNSFLSIFLIAQFCAYTYVGHLFENLIWAWVNTFIRLTLAFHAMLELIMSTDMKDHILSMQFVVELALVVPYFIIFVITKQPPDLDRTFQMHITYANLIALFKVPDLCNLIENEVNKQLVNITLTVFSIVFMFAGLVMYIFKVSSDALNKNVANLQDLQQKGYYDYIFFVMTIISTVGYENPFYGNIVLRMFIVVIIIISIATVPAKSSELISILSNKSVYSRISYKRVDSTEFIVLCGSLGTSSVINFLLEFFHEDHGNAQKHCIILNPNRPDNDMENLLRDPKYEKIIVYIQGNPLDEIDLRRAQADKAKAVIIMCNKHSINPEEEDSRTILIAIYIKKYLSTHPESQTRLCFQLLRTDGKSHYSLPANKQDKNDQLICLEELKLSLFAKSCLCPGLIAMITNLINSAGDLESDSSTPKWLEEYWHGIGFEIYKTQLSKVFKNKTFAEAANIIYKKFNAILFGIDLESGKPKICINPGSKKLVKDDIVGYIIAEDKEVADKIRDYDMEEKVQKEEEGGTDVHRIEALKSIGKLIDNEMGQGNTKLGSGNSDFNLHIQRNCIVSKTKIDINRVTYENMNGNILATNHIILAGLVSNLHHFVIPLRSKYLNKIPPIIILNEDKPDHKTWSPISYFPEIYYVKGTALNEKDLYRVNISKASRVVILSNRIEFSREDEDDKSNLK